VTGQPPQGAPPGAWPPPFPTFPQAFAPQPPPKRVRTPRRHRGIFWVAVLTSLVAVVAGTFVAITTYVDATAPDAVATDYFRALSHGDAARALAFGGLPAGPRTFLTDGVLRDSLKVAPISDVSALSVDRHGDAATVAVQYQLGSRGKRILVGDTVTLNRHGNSWRLAATAVSVRIAATVAAHRLTLAGSALPARAVLVFPGALPMSVDTPNLEISQQVVHLSDTGTHTVRPALSAAGKRAVQAAFVSAMRACLGAKPSLSCPVPTDARVVPGTVHGKVTGDLSQELTIQIAPGPDGVLDVRGSVPIQGSYRRLDFDNLPAAKSGTTDLAIRAHCDATNPGKLVWGAP
jgi:hypothetical protein